MNRILPLFLLLGILTNCTSPTQWAENPAKLVDPFIGTGGHGHTYPGATMPFGMVQLSPDTRLTGWDGCGGYHFTDSLIYGFSHTHLQGTGVSDYGDILFMPTNNTTRQGKNWGERYRSAFRKETEKAHAGYYSVHLDDHNLTAELTSTQRVGIHQYIFDEPDSCVVFIDMAHRDELISYQFEPVGDSMIIGFRHSKAWATDQYVYFAAAFSEPFEYLDQTYEIYEDIDPETQQPVQTMELVPVFPLRFGVMDTLKVKVGLSFTDVDGAMKNLQAEAPHWNFDQYLNDAEDAWNEELSKVKVADSRKDDLTLFYTGLYHSFTVPNVKTDVDGRYRSTDLKIHESDGREHYTVFSLWDTFRATHPLYTILQQEKTGDFIHTFLDQYENGGKLPMWELCNNYTGCMIGYHAVPVITDAYAKGITNYDAEKALEAMLSTAKTAELGKEYYEEFGYIPCEYEHEGVSKTLEYAYDDWCISEFSRLADVGNTTLQEEFDLRSLSYRNLYNPESGFIQPKRGAAFREGFEAREVNFNYTEANGWQYNFFSPHDVNGHIDMMGEDSFENKLDSLFHSSSTLLGRNQADITGLIGQYAHGNEPSHHMAYLYPYLGNPWKTQDLVDSIMHKYYLPTPDGISGNEDCGQMSSWYVLSALGFYSVTPGADYYVFGSPQLDNAEINLENGKTFSITAQRKSEQDKFIQSIRLNGKPYTKTYISHSTILDGGELIFEMGSQPNKTFGNSTEDRPVQKVDDQGFVAVPIINVPRTFRDPITFDFVSIQEEATIYYSIDNGENWTIYENPVPLEQTADILAYAEMEGRKSAIVASTSTRIDHDWDISITTPYDNQYAAGGNDALIDGLKGGANFKTGEWQGYYGTDVELVIDLKQKETINGLKIGALQDIRPWIWYPSSVKIFASQNGTDFVLMDEILNDQPIDDYSVAVHRFISTQPFSARYVKVQAVNFGTIPEWHLGRGNDSWLFLDEVEIDVVK